MITIQGKGVSAGVGVGPLYFYRRATAEIKRYTVEDTDAEWHRFKGAQTGAVEQLGDLAEQARRDAGDEAAMLFETHQMMAEDLDYEEAIEDRILNQKMNAEAAVSDTAEQFAEMFASMDDAYMQARAADVKDVSQRILSILCGIVQGGIASDVPVLLCADDLAPSETIQLDKTKILGFITAGGSGSSHTAILARTMGIPAIVGMGDALKPEYEGRAAIADGSTGALVIDPDDDTRDRLMKKRDEQLRLQRLPDGGQIPAVLPGQSVLPGDLPHSLVDGIRRHGARCRHPGLLQGLDAVQCAPDLVRPGKAGLHGGIFRQPRPLLFVFLLIIAVSEFRKLPVVILPGAVGFLRRAVSLPGIRLCGHPRSPCGDLRTPEIQEFLLGLVPQRPQLLLRPDTDGGRGRVAGDPLTLWEQLPNGVQDGVKLIRFPD